MEEYSNYLKNYNKLEKTIVYKFELGWGGIGDYVKFFMYLLCFCIKNDIKLHCLVNNIFIEKYLKLRDITSRFYISNESINLEDCVKQNNFQNLIPNKYNIICPQDIYHIFKYEEIFIPAQEVFYFSDEVKINAYNFIDITNYISLHLRLGDKYLETEKEYVCCVNDERNFNEEKLFEFIEKNSNHKNIVFFCDNKSYKLKIKKKYSQVVVTDSDIGHTSLMNTTDKQNLDAITEFYIMTNSEEIVAVSTSGFSYVASMFKNIPLRNI